MSLYGQGIAWVKMMKNVKCCIFIMVVSFSIHKPAQAVVDPLTCLIALAGPIVLCSSAGAAGSYVGASLGSSDREELIKKQTLGAQSNYDNETYVFSCTVAGAIVGGFCFGIPAGFVSLGLTAMSVSTNTIRAWSMLTAAAGGVRMFACEWNGRTKIIEESTHQHHKTL